jgi:hypothetical protein
MVTEHLQFFLPTVPFYFPLEKPLSFNVTPQKLNPLFLVAYAVKEAKYHLPDR